MRGAVPPIMALYLVKHKESIPLTLVLHYRSISNKQKASDKSNIA
jgi:hypothetical protein